MLYDLLSHILCFKEFLFLMIGVMVIGATVGLILANNMRWGSKRLKYLGLFIGFNKKELIILSVVIMKSLFIISCILFQTKIGIEQIVFYLGLTLLRIGLKFDIKICFFEIVNAVMILVALFFGNILTGYIHEVTSDIYLQVVYVLLQIILGLYAIYNFITNIESLLTNKRNKRKQQYAEKV